MQSTMSAQLVMDALLMAIFRRGRPQAVLHHSDRLNSPSTPAKICSGCWTHTALLAAWADVETAGSVNAAVESVFSTLKTERLSWKQYRTRDGLRADVLDYIKRFYNPKRRYSTIGYISPVQFENLQCA